MSPKELLQGNWLGHPLHPALVHVPTGLWPAALVFDLLTLVGEGSNVAVRVSFWALVVGLAAALLAAPTGVADWWDIKKEKRAHTLGLWHMILNLSVVALIATSIVLRLRQGIDATSVAGGAIAINVVANAVLAVSGYLGGRMVFEYGISVARISKKKWRRIAQEGKARLPAE